MKKTNVKNQILEMAYVQEILSKEKMNNLLGGYKGSGTKDDPYQLPEVVVRPQK